MTLKKFGLSRMGPGGINCTCCGPAPGPKRKKILRSLKRSWKQKMKIEDAPKYMKGKTDET